MSESEGVPGDLEHSCSSRVPMQASGPGKRSKGAASVEFAENERRGDQIRPAAAQPGIAQIRLYNGVSPRRWWRSGNNYGTRTNSVPTQSFSKCTSNCGICALWDAWWADVELPL